MADEALSWDDIAGGALVFAEDSPALSVARGARTVPVNHPWLAAGRRDADPVRWTSAHIEGARIRDIAWARRMVYRKPFVRVGPRLGG